jgi:hypothetical protein
VVLSQKENVENVECEKA